MTIQSPSSAEGNDFVTPTIERAVTGPKDQAGFLLRTPPNEALTWDVETEIVSARRLWIEDRQAWWIAAGYLETVITLVLRSFPSVLLLGEDEDRLLSRDGRHALQGRLL